jgi:cytochrome c oxidase subunit II
MILVPVMIWVVGPHIPPFNGSLQTEDQHDVNVTLLVLATPIATMIWVYFAYSIAVFRQPKGAAGAAIVDGPPDTGEPRIQILWLAVTSLLVVGLATFGTVDLLGSSHGAGGGQGPNPLSKPPNADHILQVQVIGQQWLWTYRFPQYGGVETPNLDLPVGQWVAFHVTSLDVIHSFWAYELGVKADAVPGSDNIAYVKPLKDETFQVRCAELCGLWHGHMNMIGRVVSDSEFASWIARQQTEYAGITKYLPPYAPAYFPAPLRRG